MYLGGGLRPDFVLLPTTREGAGTRKLAAILAADVPG